MTRDRTDSRIRRLVRTVLQGALFATLLLAHLWVSPPARATDPSREPVGATADPAASAVRWLIGADAGLAVAALPPDFSDVMGYLPEYIEGRPVDPDGDCSSPIPLPEQFETACKTHDLGYDLLRYADRTGRPLGSWARAGLDRMLIDQMRASCHDPACFVAAELSRAGLAVNSWRQDYGPPAPAETASEIAGSLVLRVAETVANRTVVTR